MINLDNSVITILLLIHLGFLLVFLFRVLWRDDLTPSARLAWFIVLITLPYFGVLVYLLTGEINLGRTIHRRHDEIFDNIHREAGSALGSCCDNLPGNVEPEYQPAFRAASSADGFETTLGNRGELLADGKTARARLIEDLDSATESINVLYYIWLDDRTGTAVARALIRAAERGVRCRAMADGLGSRKFIKSALWKEMKSAGVDLQVALPIRGIIRTILFSRLDLRNHRKITVIDSRITWCGSQNCADEEFLVKRKFAPWVDIMMRLEGPVVAQNQLLFASDWIMHRPQASLSEFDYGSVAFDEGFPVQVFGDGPTERVGCTPQLFSTLMAQACHELVISTPYFVPDQTVLNALCAAAFRGVKVRLILPQRNDSWIVAAVSQSYYRRLLEAGIQIFEFRDGLLHSKTLTVDRRVTMMGSSNLDLRSFDLNYENDILFRSDEMTAAVIERQEQYIAQSDLITLDDVSNWRWYRRIWHNIIATAGPVL